MSGKRKAAKKRVYTSFAASLAALAAAVLIGLIGGQVTSLPERIATAGDTFALTAAPDEWTGGEHFLAAGGYQGGAAITYLKFKVNLPEERLPRRSWLWLGVDRGPLPDFVELTRVPDTRWEESTTTAASAPRLGDVVASLSPAPDAKAIAFDVTRIIRSSGIYAFAITVPSGTEFARFVAREAIRTATGAPTITLEWSTSSTVEASASASASASAAAADGAAVPPNPPPFTPTPRATEAPSPVVPPWPGASPTVTASASVSASPSESASPSTSPSPTPTPSPSESASPSAPAEPAGPTFTPSPTSSTTPTASPTKTASPSPSPSHTTPPPLDCVAAEQLVPTCGALWGVAPGAHTTQDRVEALKDFERVTDKPQLIYHAYHRGGELFPTAAEIGVARDPDNPRILFLNWKPTGATWREIADGDPGVESFLERLAAHIKRSFPERFFFTMHHEPENDVLQWAGSGMTAKDYSAAFRHVILKLRSEGVTNIVSTMCYMAYVPWNTKEWFDELYPGDDVVDWVSWDVYAYSDPGHGFGDFAEMMNRRSGSRPGWPGFYNWAAKTFPAKPLMVAEWGVWYSPSNPSHHADFFNSARLQLELFPRVKAYVYFESPNAEGRDSRVHNTMTGLRSFQRFSSHPAFDVKLPRRQGDGRDESPWSITPAPTPWPRNLS